MSKRERVYQVPILCEAVRFLMIPATSAAEAKAKSRMGITYGMGALGVEYGDERVGRVRRTDELVEDWQPQPWPGVADA